MTYNPNDILTAAQAAAYLRIESRDPAGTLAYYRRRRRLRGVRAGRHIRYRFSDLERFVDQQVCRKSGD